MTTTFIREEIDEDSPFPDGMPHIRLTHQANHYAVCRIVTPNDLVNLALWADVARRNQPWRRLSVRILYLMGARMDRSISESEPYTLKVVCNLINAIGLNEVQVFCPHSQATTDLLNNYVPIHQSVEDDFYLSAIGDFIGAPIGEIATQFSIVYPDEGASKRYKKSEVKNLCPSANFVFLHKDRDERTGQILGTRIVQGTPSKDCLIIDDLCDGGATFRAAAEALRSAGAERVGLAVCHGVLSKGLPIFGIDRIYTTNSFKDWIPSRGLHVHQL